MAVHSLFYKILFLVFVKKKYYLIVLKMDIANLLLDVWGINVGQSLSVFDVLNEWNQYDQILSEGYISLCQDQFMNMLNLNLNPKLITYLIF